MNIKDPEHIISRALQSNDFIWYLNRFISGTVSWKDIKDKCLGQDNAYCLSLIKSKCWTDKTSAGGSWNERLENLIYERISLGMAHSDLLLKKELGFLILVVLEIEDMFVLLVLKVFVMFLLVHKIDFLIFIVVILKMKVIYFNNIFY
jgi:hypothetical protein